MMDAMQMDKREREESTSLLFPSPTPSAPIPRRHSSLHLAHSPMLSASDGTTSVLSLAAAAFLSLRLFPLSSFL